MDRSAGSTRGANRMRAGRWLTGRLCLQAHLSWAGDEATARRIAFDQWRSNVFGPPVSWDLELI